MTDIERLMTVQIEGTLRTMQNNKLGKFISIQDNNIVYCFDNKKIRITCEQLVDEENVVMGVND